MTHLGCGQVKAGKGKLLSPCFCMYLVDNPVFVQNESNHQLAKKINLARHSLLSSSSSLPVGGRDGVPAASGPLWLHDFPADDLLAAPDVAAVESEETLALPRALLLVADGLCLRAGFSKGNTFSFWTFSTNSVLFYPCARKSKMRKCIGVGASSIGIFRGVCSESQDKKISTVNPG